MSGGRGGKKRGGAGGNHPSGEGTVIGGASPKKDIPTRGGAGGAGGAGGGRGKGGRGGRGGRGGANVEVSTSPPVDVHPPNTAGRGGANKGARGGQRGGGRGGPVGGAGRGGKHTHQDNQPTEPKSNEFQFNFNAPAGGDEVFTFKQMKQTLAAAYESNLPKPVQTRLNALKKLQTNFSELEKEYQKELKALELKYENLYSPLYEKRANIVTGSYEPVAEDLDADQAATFQPTDAKTQDIKGIPNFWLTALKNHHLFKDKITQRDEEVLKFLQNIKCVLDSESNDNFELHFVFAENPFFTNSVLTKKYIVSEEESGHDSLLDQIVGCTIDWKSGMNVTVKKKKKKKKGRGGKVVGGGTVDCESFFRFFQSQDSPEEMLDEEEAEELEAAWEEDYEMGVAIRDDLIPEAVLWFTGEAALHEEDFLDDFDDEDEDEDLDDDDDLGNTEGISLGSKSGAPAETPAECKQQ